MALTFEVFVFWGGGLEPVPLPPNESFTCSAVLVWWLLLNWKLLFIRFFVDELLIFCGLEISSSPRYRFFVTLPLGQDAFVCAKICNACFFTLVLVLFTRWSSAGAALLARLRPVVGAVVILVRISPSPRSLLLEARRALRFCAFCYRLDLGPATVLLPEPTDEQG